MLMIEKDAYERFLKKLKGGEFLEQRVGQAFYNEFNLHRLTNQEQLHNLYEKDGENALNLIKAIFEFN